MYDKRKSGGALLYKHDWSTPGRRQHAYATLTSTGARSHAHVRDEAFPVASSNRPQLAVEILSVIYSRWGHALPYVGASKQHGPVPKEGYSLTGDSPLLPDNVPGGYNPSVSKS